MGAVEYSVLERPLAQGSPSASARQASVSGYRRDIDGLRTLAVLPVILFHLDIGVFTGGYVGVDVFFVISGFLITSIIARELGSDGFSILRFYERRFRRILPALTVVIAACLAAGMVLLSPQDLSDLGKSVVATALFASNMLFWKQDGYFTSATELKPLAHTWSLAVEEQFYIFFPLVLAFLWKRAGRYVLWCVGGAILLSLALCVLGVAQGWSAAYFMLPFRAWELLIGAGLALIRLPTPKSRAALELLGIAGLVCILLPGLLLNAGSPFPGWNALPPVFGAALLIHVGTDARRGLATQLLSLQPMVWIGLLSYSLYLWHWPLIAFSRHLLFDPSEPVVAAFLLVATFLSAFLSWRFVERPFRARLLSGRRALLGVSAMVIGAGVAAGCVLVVARGLPQRFPELAVIERQILAQRAEDRKTQCIIGEAGLPWPGATTCTVGHGSGARILFWGDSHANHFVRALRQLDDQTQGTILAYGMTGCAPILDLPANRRPNCIASKNRVFDLIREHRIQRVLISGLWEPRADRLTGTGPQTLADTLQRLRATGVEVVVIGDTPAMPLEDPLLLYPRLLRSANPRAPLYVEPNNDPAINRDLARVAGPGQFFDPTATLCRDGGCLMIDQGEPLYIDSHHLSRFGARRVLKAMGPLLD